MTKYRNAANISKDVGAVKYRNAANVLKEAATIKVRNASNALKTVFQSGAAFAVDAPDVVYGAGYSTSPVAITTALATATPLAGTAPFTYIWARTDASGELWTIISATAQSTSFRASLVAAGEVNTASFHCTVTDKNGNFVISNDVIAEVQNYEQGL